MISLRANERRADLHPSPVTLHFERGSAIYSQGDEATFWFEVIAGTVRTCHFHVDGHRQLTGFFYAGDVFGVGQSTYRETAEAVTEVTVRRHCSIMEDRTNDNSESRELALRRALQSAQDCIFLLGHRTATERVAAFLLAIASKLPSQVQLQVPMSRGDIADHLGLTIHTVSRTISHLARMKLISVETPHSVRIIDATRLASLAGDAQRETCADSNFPSSKNGTDCQVA